MVKTLVSVLILAISTLATAQTQRAVMVREAPIYISPDTRSAKLGTVGRGREVAIMDQSREYIKVFAELGEGRNVTGWIRDIGVIRDTTANGDRILFGEAVDSEAEAARRGGRKNADKDALRLYYRAYEHFPKSPLAGEALWRAADIDWQLNKAERLGRRSAREQDPLLRGRIETNLMDEVRKKFTGTKWASLASFAKLDNELCGEWQGSAKCPEKESEKYEEYVKNHPQSPKAAEALYESAWRQAALIDMYRADNDQDKSQKAAARAKALLQRIQSEYAQQGDWPARALALLFKVEQGIPTYGVAAE